MGDLFLVPPDRIPLVWNDVSDLVEKGAESLGFYGAEHVLPYLEDGRWQLWVVGDREIECVCLTEIQTFPNATVLIIRGLAGDGWDRWFCYLDTIEQWAKERGCDRVRAIGRPGLERRLPEYRKAQVYMEKRL